MLRRPRSRCHRCWSLNRQWPWFRRWCWFRRSRYCRPGTWSLPVKRLTRLLPRRSWFPQGSRCCRRFRSRQQPCCPPRLRHPMSCCCSRTRQLPGRTKRLESRRGPVEPEAWWGPCCPICHCQPAVVTRQRGPLASDDYPSPRRTNKTKDR